MYVWRKYVVGEEHKVFFLLFILVLVLNRTWWCSWATTVKNRPKDRLYYLFFFLFFFAFQGNYYNHIYTKHAHYSHYFFFSYISQRKHTKRAHFVLSYTIIIIIITQGIFILYVCTHKKHTIQCIIQPHHFLYITSHNNIPIYWWRILVLFLLLSITLTHSFIHSSACIIRKTFIVIYLMYYYVKTNISHDEKRYWFCDLMLFRDFLFDKS